MEIADHASDRRKRDGGKRASCALTRATLKGLEWCRTRCSVEYSDVEASQNLTSPWTSELTYSEHRTLSILGANISCARSATMGSRWFRHSRA